jgi:hypothetical protein
MKAELYIIFIWGLGVLSGALSVGAVWFFKHKSLNKPRKIVASSNEFLEALVADRRIYIKDIKVYLVPRSMKTPDGFFAVVTYHRLNVKDYTEEIEATVVKVNSN